MEPSVNSRHEPRFPCVGIGLTYSTRERANSRQFGQDIFEASLLDLSLSGMAFDVDRSLEPETRITVLIKNPDGLEERLESQVVWCSRIEQNRYRIGVQIDHAMGISAGEVIDTKYVNIQTGASVPVTTRFYCPGCKNKTYFDFVGTESPSHREDGLPLYNCSGCGTTRTIYSILSFNRARLLQR